MGFDDLPKVANDVVNDDYHTSGYQLKAKQKTSYAGTVVSTQVDLFPSKEAKAVATPAKLTLKWPTPFGIKQAFIDKLEVDKGGKFKLEATSNEVHPGLKLECKSDLADLNKVTAGFTYTGEVTYTKDIATVGMKLSGASLKGGAPDLGIRVLKGPWFCSMLMKDKFKTTNAAFFYKASDDVKCALTYTHGGKDNGKYTIGVNYKGIAKMKVNQDQQLSCSYKHSVSKGFTLLSGATYGIKKGDATCGVQLSIE